MFSIYYLSFIIKLGSYDKSIRIWDAQTGSCLQTLNGHNSYVLSVAFSPDGAKIASGKERAEIDDKIDDYDDDDALMIMLNTLTRFRRKFVCRKDRSFPTLSLLFY